MLVFHTILGMGAPVAVQLSSNDEPSVTSTRSGLIFTVGDSVDKESLQPCESVEPEKLTAVIEGEIGKRVLASGHQGVGAIGLARHIRPVWTENVVPLIHQLANPFGLRTFARERIVLDVQFCCNKQL